MTAETFGSIPLQVEEFMVGLTSEERLARESDIQDALLYGRQRALQARAEHGYSLASLCRSMLSARHKARLAVGVALQGGVTVEQAKTIAACVYCAALSAARSPSR